MDEVWHSEPVHDRLDLAVAKVAAKQHGAFSRDEAARCGATLWQVRHRLETGRWLRLGRDVFAIAGAPRTYRRDLMAATLAWGEGAVASHRAAAALWHLAGVEARIVEITVPRTRKREGAPPATAVHRNVIAPRDRTVVDGIPTTTVARTMIDLAALVPGDAVEEALDDALRRALVSLPRLRHAVETHPHRPGVRALRRFVEARTAPAIPQSVFETRLLRVLTKASLPRPVIQHEIREPTGRLVAVVDLAYPDARLAIEADGYRWHSGRAPWERDRRRRNALTRLGWRVVHVTWQQLQARPDEITTQIAEILDDGHPTPANASPARR